MKFTLGVLPLSYTYHYANQYNVYQTSSITSRVRDNFRLTVIKSLIEQEEFEIFSKRHIVLISIIETVVDMRMKKKHECEKMRGIL